jgi:hypothetical protein
MTLNQALAALKVLDKAEAKAHRAMMTGSEADACSIRGQEGKNYLAWIAAADACYDHRKAHNLLGLRSRRWTR